MPVGSRQEKVWGRTRCLASFNCVEVHELELAPRDGKRVVSSWHKHHLKHNRFVVMEGMLRVEWEGGARTFGKGDSAQINAGTPHRFMVLGPARVIEITWADSVGEDIERLDTGHVLEDENDGTEG